MSRHPQQNGVAKCKHRHLRELGLTLSFVSKVPLIYWPEAFQTACFLINRLPSSIRSFNSPFYLLYKERPDYSCLRTFGSRCFPLLKGSTPHKLAPKSLPCVFLGYSDRHKGYKCLYPATGKLFISRSVVFDESHFPYHNLQTLHTPSSDLSSIITHFSKTANPHSPSQLRHPSRFDHDHDDSPPCPPLQNSSQTPNQDPLPSSTPTSPPHASPSPDHHQPPQNTHQMITRSKDGISCPNRRYLLNCEIIPEEPKSVKTALRHPGWKGAMEAKIQALIDQDTFQLVPQNPEMRVLSTKWVWKTKLKSDGSLDKLKARYVAKGFNQVAGIDF